METEDVDLEGSPLDNRGTDANMAAERIFSFLDEDGNGPEGQPDPDSEDEDPDSDVSADAEDEEDLDDEERDSNEPDDDDVGDEAEDGTEDDPAPQTFTVKVDGEEFDVTLDEALAGYQRQQAFTRKTQEVAEQRKAVQEEAEALRNERTQYGQALMQAEQFLQAQMPEAPDESLRARSPRKYAEQLENYQAAQQKLQAVHGEQQRLLQQMEQEERQQKQDKLEEEQEKLVSALPEWVDEDKAREEKEKIANYAITTYGFTEEDLGSLVDHRPVLLLRKAMLYDEMQKKGEKVKRATRKKDPPNLKPGSSKSPKDSKGSKSKKAARNRLRKSGSVHDAAQVFHGLLDD